MEKAYSIRESWVHINDFCGREKRKDFPCSAKKAEYKEEVTMGQRRLRCIHVWDYLKCNSFDPRNKIW